MEKEKLKSLIYIMLPILGTVFVCWYITAICRMYTI